MRCRNEVPADPARRRLFALLAAGLPCTSQRWLNAQAGESADIATLAAGDLVAVVRDNSQSPQVLSGLDSLMNVRSAPGFDAFDPDSKGASAGINFEHIICGHKDSKNAFAPRHGPFSLVVESDGASAALVRTRGDDPWSMSSRLTYRLAAPHYVDVDFRCVPHQPQRFGKRGYAIMFFANYMNDVVHPALNFLGIDRPNGKEQWLAVDAPREHADWNQGGTYRHVEAAPLEYDAEHNFKLNSWSYDFPRYTLPFFYGRAAHQMVCMLMFDKSWTALDEMRFSLFKFKLRRFPRPAWDFQYVVRQLEAGRPYGFRARLVWKKFVDREDCLREYLAWSASLPPADQRKSK